MMQDFDKNILKVIQELSYNMFIVQQYNEINCSCVDFTTKQAKHDCPKCLGTGKKIKIKKIQAARQNGKMNIRGIGIASGELITIGVFYIDATSTEIFTDNLIVDHNDVFVIQRIEAMRSDKYKPIYYKCEAVSKSSNVKIFLKLFKKIVESV